MKTTKIKLKLQQCLDIAKKGLFQAMSLNETNKTYKKLMKKVIKQYRKVVRLARKLERIYPEPLIKINKRIITELRKYNKFRRINSGTFQLGKSTLAPIVFLTTVGMFLLTIEKETLSQIDENNNNTNQEKVANDTSQDEKNTNESSEGEETVDYKTFLVQGVKLYKEGEYNQAIAKWEKIPSDSDQYEQAQNFTKMAEKKLEATGEIASSDETTTQEEQSQDEEVSTSSDTAETVSDEETVDYKANMVQGINLFKNNDFAQAIAEWEIIPSDSEYYEKAQNFIKKAEEKLSAQEEDTSTETKAPADQPQDAVIDYKSTFENGEVLYNNNEYENAVTEWEKIPIASEYYDKAQENIEMAKDNLTEQETTEEETTEEAETTAPEEKAAEETTEEVDTTPSEEETTEETAAEATPPVEGATEDTTAETTPPAEEAKSDIKDSYEIYNVKKGDSLWEITEKFYKKFSNDNIYFFIDNILSPMNKKGLMRNYKWTDVSSKNPHLIYPREKIKVPDLKEVDPSTIPHELKNVVNYDKDSKLYTARLNDGKIVLLNPSKNSATVASI